MNPNFLDVDAMRSAFPALRREHEGLPVAYFDGPGGTQVPALVAEAMSDYLLHHNANTHWVYPTSVETDAALGAARSAVADFVAASPAEVAFGANMTTLTFHLGRALARGWKAGDEIVVTELDHHANVDPWRQLAREHGFLVRSVPFEPSSGELEIEKLPGLLGKRTRLLAIGAASNALGTVNDVRRAADLAHEAGALVFVDAVHYAPHVLVDVGALGADFLACSAYKFYGPHLGILWGRHALLEALDAPRLTPAPSTAPEKLETGTQNHEGIVGAGAAVNFLAGLTTGFLAGGTSGLLAGEPSGLLAGRTSDSPPGRASGSVAGSPSGSSRRERLAHGLELLHRRGEALVARLWSGLRPSLASASSVRRPAAPERPPWLSLSRGWSRRTWHGTSPHGRSSSLTATSTRQQP